MTFALIFQSVDAALQAKEGDKTAENTPTTETPKTTTAIDTLSSKRDSLAHNEVDSLLNKTAQKKDSLAPAQKNPLFDLFNLPMGKTLLLSLIS